MTSSIPVLELEPGTFSPVSPGHPLGSAAESPAAWDAYWKESLANAGITDLTPWRPGSWLVPLDQLSMCETLRVVMRYELADVAGWLVASECTHDAWQEVCIEPRQTPRPSRGST